MAAPQNFRTAFHGFNREDVVRYIDYLTAKHTAQVNELKNEIDFLRSKTDTHGLDMVTPERMFEAEIQRDEYKEQLDAQAILIHELEAKCAALEQGKPVAMDNTEAAAWIAELEERCVNLEVQLIEAQVAPQHDTPDLAAMDFSLSQAIEAKRQAEEALDACNVTVAELEDRCAALEKELADALAANPLSADPQVFLPSDDSELEARCAALEKELSEALAAKTQAESAWNAHTLKAAQIERRCILLEKELAEAVSAKHRTESDIVTRDARTLELENRCTVLEKELADAIAAKQQTESDIETRDARTLELENRCIILEKELADAIAAKQQTESDIAARDARTLELENRCIILEKELAGAVAAKKQVEQEREISRKYHIEQELEAYRRAERAERVAKERADQIYNKANGVLADATVKVDEATAQISGLADQVMDQLRQLQSAVIGSKQALSDAAASMYVLRPETEDK